MQRRDDLFGCERLQYEHDDMLGAERPLSISLQQQWGLVGALKRSPLRAKPTSGHVMPKTNRLIPGLTIALALSLSACASIHAVTGVTTTRDRILFFIQDDIRDNPSSVVDCTRAPDGALSDCRRKAIVYPN